MDASLLLLALVAAFPALLLLGGDDAGEDVPDEQLDSADEDVDGRTGGSADPPQDYVATPSEGALFFPEFRPGLDRVTIRLEAGDARTELSFDAADRPTLWVSEGEGSTTMTFAGLDAVPENDIWFELPDDGGNPFRLTLADVTASGFEVLDPTDPDAPEDPPPPTAGVGLAPTDPDLPDRPPERPSGKEGLAPTDPDTPDVPPPGFMAASNAASEADRGSPETTTGAEEAASGAERDAAGTGTTGQHEAPGAVDGRDPSPDPDDGRAGTDATAVGPPSEGTDASEGGGDAGDDGSGEPDARPDDEAAGPARDAEPVEAEPDGDGSVAEGSSGPDAAAPTESGEEAAGWEASSTTDDDPVGEPDGDAGDEGSGETEPDGDGSVAEGSSGPDAAEPTESGEKAAASDASSATDDGPVGEPDDGDPGGPRPSIMGVSTDPDGSDGKHRGKGRGGVTVIDDFDIDRDILYITLDAEWSGGEPPVDLSSPNGKDVHVRFDGKLIAKVKDGAGMTLEDVVVTS